MSHSSNPDPNPHPAHQPDHQPAEHRDQQPGAVARIGPNAIIRVGEALRFFAHPDHAAGGPQDAGLARPGLGAVSPEQIFADARLSHYLEHPPSDMVPETEVIALQQALRAALPPEVAGAVSRDAGRRTGDYLLAHRIPKPAQRLLKWLPPGPACRMLLKAVASNAWTFVGSGHYAFTMGRPVRVSIAQCPICRGATATAPVCDFYAGAFERLCQILVSSRARVRETQCQALGAPACEFQIDWER